MGRYGALWGTMGLVVGRCGALWGSMGHYGALWGTLGLYGLHYEDLWGSMGHMGLVVGRYGALWGSMGCIMRLCGAVRGPMGQPRADAFLWGAPRPAAAAVYGAPPNLWGRRCCWPTFCPRCSSRWPPPSGPTSCPIGEPWGGPTEEARSCCGAALRGPPWRYGAAPLMCAPQRPRGRRRHRCVGGVLRCGHGGRSGGQPGG